MSNTFKQKISNYINELEKRGVIVVEEGDDTSEDYKIYDVVYEYNMKYNDDEIYRIVYHVDGHLEFTNAIDVDILIIDDASNLPLLSNIQITLDLPKVDEDDDEPKVFVNDRLEVIEKRLDKLTQLIITVSERLDNISGVQPLIRYGKKNIILPFVIANKSTEISGNWYDAVSYCASLGDGWRLPTKDELDYIYHSKNDFVGCFYWSSTEFDDDNAWFQHFSNGSPSNFSKNSSFYVRAVKDIK